MLKFKEITKEGKIKNKNWSHCVRGLEFADLPKKLPLFTAKFS